MPEPNYRRPQSPPDDHPASAASAPYEVPLTKAFDKLTSEIFIFLLAYVILLVGLAVFGSQLASTLRNLLYVIPVLGVVAYAWLQRQGIVRDAKEKGIDVKAGIVGGSAKVVGVRGAKAGSHLQDNVKVGAGLATGSAQVVGVVYGDDEPEVPRSSSLEVLAEIFKHLSQSNQIKVITNAQSLLDKQGPTNA